MTYDPGKADEYAMRRAKALVRRLYGAGHCIPECSKCTTLVKAIAREIAMAGKHDPKRPRVRK